MYLIVTSYHVVLRLDICYLTTLIPPFTLSRPQAPVGPVCPKGNQRAKSPWPLAPSKPRGVTIKPPEVTVEMQLALACTSSPAFGLIVEMRLMKGFEFSDPSFGLKPGLLGFGV